MRQIDQMTPQEVIVEYKRVNFRMMTLESTLIGIKLALEEQGGYENTIKQIDVALAKQ